MSVNNVVNNALLISSWISEMSVVAYIGYRSARLLYSSLHHMQCGIQSCWNCLNDDVEAVGYAFSATLWGGVGKPQNGECVAHLFSLARMSLTLWDSRPSWMTSCSWCAVQLRSSFSISHMPFTMFESLSYSTSKTWSESVSHCSNTDMIILDM